MSERLRSREAKGVPVVVNIITTYLKVQNRYLMKDTSIIWRYIMGVEKDALLH